MIKVKVPEGVTHLSVDGESIHVKDGIAEVKEFTPFLRDNGFEIATEEDSGSKADAKAERETLKARAKELEIEFAKNASNEQIAELIKAKEAEIAEQGNGAE